MSFANDMTGTCQADTRPAPTRAVARLGCGLSLIAVLLAAAGCSRPMTDDILPGGVPARTNLHATTQMPPDAIRTVARNDAGWRLIYHPARAPADAAHRASAALCSLESKRATQIVIVPMTAPQDDPGATMIDVVCG